MKRLALPLLALASTPPAAAADSFSQLGRSLEDRRFVSSREDTEVTVNGYLRIRGEALYNLDLDHGLTPSGEPLFFVPLDGEGQLLTSADTRFRTDVAIYPRGVGAAVKARIDVLDNLVLGSTPNGNPSSSRAPTPSASPGQTAPERAFLVRTAWGEVLTPLGVLAVGRMNNQWGLGIVANSGDCEDCDGSDVADRIAFATTIIDHFLTVAYDFSASGPLARRKDDARFLDVLPTDDVRTFTVATGRIRSPRARERRRAAGRFSADYGGYFSYRSQRDDVPADYLPTTVPSVIDADQIMHRDYRATALSGFLLLTAPSFTIGAELAWLTARVGEPSLIPGLELDTDATSNQLGGAIESTFWVSPSLGTGLNAGFASGDDAPGFGAFPRANAPAALPGDLDGPQSNLTTDSTVDNFRFAPDYRIDKILFREIIGTVTDAIYLRPHVGWTLTGVGPGSVTLTLAAVASWAAQANSTPSGDGFLGVELDPTLRYESEGFVANLDYAVFMPGSGLDNRVSGQDSRSAQLWRLRLGVLF